MDETNDILAVRTNLIASLRRLTFRRTKILRSLAYAVAYSIVSSCFTSVISSISSSYIWLSFAQITTSLLLEGLHLRWTQAIVSKTSPAKGIFAYPWQKLLLPALVHAVAQKATMEMPLSIGTGSSDALYDAIAIRSMAGLALAFALRFFVLYPAWASLICSETGIKKQLDRMPEARTGKRYLRCYWDTTRMCYRKVLLRLAGLHLQAAGILILFEAVLYVLFTTLSTELVEQP
jgi:hypothetical protein